MSDTFLNQMTKEYNPVDVQARQAALRTKWEKSNLLKNLNEGKANVVAQLLENQAIEAKNTMLRESSQTGAIAGYNKIAFPLVRRVFGQLLATELVSVQPMSLPAGLLFFLDFKYDRTKSGGTAGGSVYGDLTDRGNTQQDGAGVAAGTGGFYDLGGQGYSRRNFKVLAQGVSMSTIDGAAWTAADDGSADGGDAFVATATSEFFNGATVSAYAFDITANKDAVDLGALNQFRIALSSELTNITSDAFRSLDAVNSMPAATLFGTIDPNMTYFDSSGTREKLVVWSNAVLDETATPGAAGSIVVVGPAKTNISVDNGTNNFGDFEAVSEIPEVDIAISSIPVQAVTRKLKATWTPELAQDISAYHAVDAEVELITVLSDIISTEVDREILSALISGAAVKGAWSRLPGRYLQIDGQGLIRDAAAESLQSAVSTLSVSDGFTGTNQDWYQTLLETINSVSNEIHKRNMRSGANWIVTSPDVATILESMAYFKPNASFDGQEVQFSMGIEKVGTLTNRYTVYKDPYFPADKILVGYKGPGFLDAGFVYAPYVPLVFTPTIFEPNDFTPRKGAMTRYASQMVRPEYYGLVTVTDLGIIATS